MNKNYFLWIAILATFVLLNGYIGNAISFSDVPANHINSDAIEYVKGKNIVEGYPDGNFIPDQTINRAEFIKIIISAQFSQTTIDNCITENIQEASAYAFFPDAPKEDWFATTLCVAKMNQMIDGYPDGTFKPENTINFAEAAKIISNAFDYSVTEDDIWYKPFIKNLGEKSAIPETIKSFHHNITRGEMAEMIYRLRANVTTKKSLDYETILQVDPYFLATTLRVRLQNLKKIPEYSVKEIIEQGQSQIIINSIDSLNAQFTYDQIDKNPFFEGASYEQIDNTLVLTIDRKGSLEPLEITEVGPILNIHIPKNNQTFPQFSNLYPKRDSITNPTLQTISVDVIMNAGYKDGFMILDGQQEKFEVSTRGINQYSLILKKNLEENKVYDIKVIVLDNQNRASAAIWQFEATEPIENIPLPLDRFKYLGWWGRVNQNEVSVMKEANNQSAQLDTFSTINRIKVLEETRGETIGNNDIWYKIDGGRHPGAFIFSGYVTPIKQPLPPTVFNIPKIVKNGEYWIDLDIDKKILTLFAYDKPIFATYAATGKMGSPTIVGTYRVWYKLLKTRMRGGPPAADHYYDLPNVPWVMFYHRGYAIHGTYWHDKFGTQQSAGCTNLTNGDAKFIFSKTLPSLMGSQNSILSSDINIGTVIHNH